MNKYIGKLYRCTTIQGNEYVGICKDTTKHTFTFQLVSTTNKNWKHKIYTWDRTGRGVTEPELIGDPDDFPGVFHMKLKYYRIEKGDCFLITFTNGKTSPYKALKTGKPLDISYLQLNDNKKASFSEGCEELEAILLTVEEYPEYFI